MPMLTFSGALGLGSELEIAVSTGEIQNDEIVVLCGSAHGGGHVGADEVNRTGLQLHDHGRAVSAGARSSALSICGRQESYQIVPDCAVHLPPARSAMDAAEA